MKNTIHAGRKLLCVITALALVITIFSKPAPAAAQSWTFYAADGAITVTPLENDFKDGKYRFNIKISYSKGTSNGYGVDIRNVKLVNSSGNTVATWSSKTVLGAGGTTTQHYSVDFTQYASGTYKFYYTVMPEWGVESKTFWISVNHSAGKVTYHSSKYFTDTNGDKWLKVKFSLKQLKGYTPKLQIYDSNGNLIKTINGSSKVAYTDSVYSFNWNMEYNNGAPIRSGSYTFKLTCNGKSCCKKLTLNP